MGGMKLARAGLILSIVCALPAVGEAFSVAATPLVRVEAANAAQFKIGRAHV